MSMMTTTASSNPTPDLKTTTKDTVAASRLTDMERVLQMIDVEDYTALEKMLMSGRAFHLPKGLEVYVTSEAHQQRGILRLRPKGAIADLWASVNSIA